MYKGMKRSAINVILLSIVTCGIYGIYWMYTVGKEINEALNREAVNPVLALLSLICYPVIFYYVYTLDKALGELSEQRGTTYNSNFVIWVITMLFGLGMFVVEFQTQETLNAIWDKAE